MRPEYLAAAVLAALGVLIGTATDRAPDKPEVRRGGYRVLEGDFHVHTRFSDGFSSPMDIPFLARRQGLDVVGVTEHNNVLPGKIARFISDHIGGARVVVGEEITSKQFHMIALGLKERVAAGISAREAIARVHAQHGIAIAAHPVRPFWAVFDEAAEELDGAEVMHPIAFRGAGGDPRGLWRWRDMVEFYEAQRGRGRRMAAIGSSDYHFFKVLGACRTLIFASDDRPESIVDAIAHGRTVVIDRDGKRYGDPEIIALLEKDPLPDRGLADAPGYESNGAADAAGRVMGFIGLIGLLIFRPRAGSREADPSGPMGGIMRGSRP